MRLVSTKDCRPGMRLGKPVFTDSGQILVNEKMVLTESMIDRLHRMGYEYLFIDDPRSDDIFIEDTISMETRMALRLTLETVIDRVMRQNEDGEPLNISRECWNSVKMLVRDLKKRDDTIITVNAMPPDKDVPRDHFIQNAINVCVYATKIGISQGWPEKDLMAFGLGGLLHDIGKLRLSQDILHKPAALTKDEFEHVKTHVVIGYELLKNEPGIPPATAFCALMHHERIDGSGYPHGFKKDDIHPFARWIGLIDAYDAMTNPRPYRKAILPHEAMEILYTQAGSLYDYDKVELLRKKLAIFPPGLQVRLNTGQTAVVSKINPSFPHRPIVRIIADKTGFPPRQPYDFDLSKHLNVVIADVSQVVEIDEQADER